MKKVINPYIKQDNYICFGCSPNNDIGLKLEFFEDGDEIISYWEPKKHFEGYINVLHGGIQTTLLDEIASWVIHLKAKTAGVTSSIDIKFKKPVLISKGKITLKAKIVETNKRLVKIQTFLFDSDNILCSEAEIIYFIYNPDFAKEKLAYPGYENFFEKE
ncbi:MAG: PaaI family thioesterase [Bacteroidales bacterium]|nr:PaaI family thioesterase [Bacteroidales bacterium]